MPGPYPAALRSRAWTDSFDRPDGPLGLGWIDAHEVRPDLYDSLGIYDGQVAFRTVYGRDLTGGRYYQPPYLPETWAGSPPSDPLMIYPGFGTAVRQMPDGWIPDVEITWSGNVDPAGSGEWVEAAPLLWWNPDHPAGGFGCWLSAIGASSTSNGMGFGIIGFQAAPPDNFSGPDAPVVGVFGWTQTPGDRHTLRIRQVPGDEVEVIFDGVLQWTGDLTTEPFASLIATSTGLHGVALDGHYQAPIETVLTTGGIHDVRFHDYWPQGDTP